MKNQTSVLLISQGKKIANWLIEAIVTMCITATLASAADVVSWQHLSTLTGDIPSPAASSGQSAALVLDIDKNGINDFVIATWYSTQPVVWYRYSSSGWTKYIIDTQTQYLEAGGAFYDIDKDGDLDIVLGDVSPGNGLYWWENPYPNFSPAAHWTRHIIRESGNGGYHDMVFGDFDGDGQVEFVTWNAGTTLLMSKIPDNPRTSGPWPMQTIYSSGGVKREGLAAADINGDGKQEIVGGGLWFEYSGNGNFTPHVIDNTMGITRCAAGHLISGSTYPQVVFCPGDADGPAKWYQWNGSNWQSHTLLSSVIHGHSLALADINGDGYLDVFIGEMAQWGGSTPQNPNAKVRVLYGDGSGNFTTQIVNTGQGVHESKVADLNGDGKLDILGKPFLHNIPRLDIWLNIATSPPSPNTSDSNQPVSVIRTLTIKAGKTRAALKDSFTIKGTFGAAAQDIAGSTAVYIRLSNVDEMIFEGVIPYNSAKLKYGKYSYVRHKAEPGNIRSAAFNLNKKTFRITAKGINLTGLSCPILIELEWGNYLGDFQANEDVVNGKRLIPMALLSGYADALRVDKASVHVSKKANSDSLKVTGDIAFASGIEDLTQHQLTLYWGAQDFTVPAGGLKALTNGKFRWTRPKGDTNPVKKVVFNLQKCTFTIYVANTTIASRSGTVPLTIVYDAFDQTAAYHLH
jgi:hypothetical protein